MSFEREKHLLLEIQKWAASLGWDPTPTVDLDFSARQKADVAMEKQGQSVRIAVLPKSKENQGVIRLQAVPTFSEAEYIWKPRKKKWEIEIGGVPMARFDDASSFAWLINRLFAR